MFKWSEKPLFQRQREAEEIRNSLLDISGKLM
jgi:hypothetical protein